MLNQRLKILISIFLSFTLVQGYVFFSENPGIVSVQADNIKGLLSNIRFSVPSFAGLLSLNFPQLQDADNGSFNTPDNSLDLPSKPGNFQEPPPVFNPTDPLSKPTKIPTKKPQISKKPTRIPTQKPKPTTPPKATKTPTPSPMKIGVVRPGNSLREIADIAEKITCTPAALILGQASIESGSMMNLSASTFKFYNTYGWWKNATLSQVCAGYGYSYIGGLIPSDSANAGQYCAENIKGTPTDPVMGIMQMMGFEQNAYLDEFEKALGTGVADRRVIFDAMVLAGFHFRNISTYRGPDCKNWELKYVAKTACKYHGACIYDYGTGNAGDSCRMLCEAYAKFGGPKLNCANTTSTLSPAYGTCDIK